MSVKAEVFHIYLMDADGSNVVQLTEGGGPRWSPDGTLIAFVDQSHIHVMREDSTGVIQITDSAESESHPAWSPDGTKLAFTATVAGNPDIYSLDLGLVQEGWTLDRRIQVTDETTYQGDPSLVFANGHYYVAHSHIVSGDWCSGNWEIFIREFDADWNFVQEIRITDAATAEVHPGIGFANGRFSVTYSSRTTACSGNGHVFVKEYDADWNLLQTIQLTDEGWLEEHTSLALVDGDYYVGYGSYETGSSEIYFKRYDTNWSFIERISGLTSSDPNLQEQPNLCLADNKWAVGYISYETGTWHAYVRTFDTNWNPIDKLLVDTGSGAQGTHVAYGDGQYHVSYRSWETDPQSVFVNHYTSGWNLVRKDQIAASGNASGTTFLTHEDGTYLLAFGVNGDVYVDLYTTSTAPDADFTASPLSGPVPLDVQFTDQSTGAITTWEWTFGDGGISGARFPAHTYQDPDTYTVSLTVTGPGGSDTKTRTDYITAVSDGTPPVASISFIWWDEPPFPAPPVRGQHTIYFNGSCYDTDEGGAYIVAYNWRSDLDGWLSSQEDFTLPASSLSASTHTLAFKCQDDEGQWSEEVTRTLTVSPPTGEVRTLILANRQKLEALYGTPEATQVMAKLGELTAHPSVEGLVVEVEKDAAVAAAYAAWDTDPTDTAKANAVTAAIKDVVDAQWADHPEMEYLILAGDDRALPFHRVLDQTRHPESKYRSVSCSSTTGAALCDDMTLTDDYYADAEPTVPDSPDWDGHDLYLPDLGSGRLIETPTEIAAQIDAFLAGDAEATDNAVVTGYDFAKDAAQEICDLLRSDGTASDCSLTGQTWNRDDLIAQVLNTRHNLASINGHASHYGIGTPSGDVYSSDVAAASADHTRALFYTVGCHSGLNVPPTNPTEPLDTAQALVQQGANYVANTGYGWGYVTTIGLSEQLMLDFTERLIYGQSATVGQALAAAKQEYYLDDGDLDYYDEKILIESTLYGLPMYRYTTPTTAARLPTQDLAATVLREEQMTVLGDGLTMNSLSYQFPALLAASTDDGQYYSLGDLVHASDGEPIQPKYVADLSFPQTEAHGVMFRGGAYADETTFNPVVDRAITETATLPEPSFDALTWYPPVLQRLNRLERGDKLVTLLGQFNPQSQTERVYDRLRFDVYYHVGSDDWLAPSIACVRSRLDAGTAQITLRAEDASGIHAVVVAYTDGLGEWDSVSLAEGGGLWSGSFPASTGSLFFIQVADEAGNVGVDHKEWQYYRPGEGSCSIVYLPLVRRTP
jgi:PKD repeat protein